MVYSINENRTASTSTIQQEGIMQETTYSIPMEVKEEQELIIDDIEDSNVRWCFISGLDDDDDDDDEVLEEQKFFSGFSTNEILAGSSHIYGIPSHKPQLLSDDIIEITDEEDDIYDTVNKSFSSCTDDVCIANEPIESSFINDSSTSDAVPISNEHEYKNPPSQVENGNDFLKKEEGEEQYESKKGLEISNECHNAEDTKDIKLPISPTTRRHRRSKEIANNSLSNVEAETQSIASVKEMLALKTLKIRCHICKEIFTFSTYAWLKHMRDLHHDFHEKLLSTYRFSTENLAFCKLCRININYKVGHLFHFISNHCGINAKDTSIFLCSQCDYADSSVFELQKHQKQCHSLEKEKTCIRNDTLKEGLECPKCPDVLKNNTALELHFYSSHSREFSTKFRYSCHICAIGQKCESSKKSYLDHMMNAHKLNNWKVLKFRKFENSQYLQCTECLKIFTKPDDIVKLLIHFLSHQESCFWKCKYCESSHRFQDYPAMHLCAAMKQFYHNKCHNKNHDEEENKSALRKITCWEEFEVYVKHVCPFCQDEFEKFDEWRLHIRESHHINTLEGLNMCPIPDDQDKLQCLECFAQITKSAVELHKHRFQHLPYMPYKCRHCQQNLATYALALSHVLQRCDMDGKEAFSKPSLGSDGNSKSIKERQNNVSPLSFISYSCPMCNNKRFSDLEETTQHFRTIHNNFQQYFTKNSGNEQPKSVCKICRTALNRNSNSVIVPHYFHHLDEKPFKCRKCNRTFSLHKRAIHHIKSYHTTYSDDFSETETSQATVKEEKVDHNTSLLIEMNAVPAIKKEKVGGDLGKSRKANIKKESEVEVNQFKKPLKREKVTDLKKSQKANVKKEEGENTKSTVVKQEKESKLNLGEIKDKESKNNNAEIAEETPFLLAKGKVLQEFKDHIAYACPECNKSQKSHEMWEHHIRKQHTFFNTTNLFIKDTKSGILKCPDCPLTLPDSISGQRRHRLTHLPHPSFICNICQMRFTQICSIFSHLRNIHFAQSYLKCPICQKASRTPYARSVHIKDAHPRKSWPKDMCVLCFDTVDDMDAHIKKNHTYRKKFNCEICGMYFSKGLEQHMATKHPKGKSIRKRKASPAKEEIAVKQRKRTSDIKTNGTKHK